MERLDADSATVLRHMLDCYGIEPVLIELEEMFVRLAERSAEEMRLEDAKRSAMVAADLERTRKIMAMVHGWRE